MVDQHLISLQPGTVIAGRYEVVKCLGAGSMGLVYACRHRELSGHLVAVKVLFPEVAQDKIAAARFRNEIFASYGVSHPNVVRAYEYIKDGDLIAYTMEYVGGGDLADRLSRSGDRMAVDEAVRVLAQMCAGVQAIHDAGIVHRDLKPENILLTKDGQVKIADFGIARTGHGPRLTEHGGVVGTLDYVSPEYMLNSQVDWRSDIYAIGILGYEMVVGESPYRGDSVFATMSKRLNSDPPFPSTLRPDCPRPLDDVILKAMHRDPEQRYQSAADMFGDLLRMFPDWVSPVGGAKGAYRGPRVETDPEPDHSAPQAQSAPTVQVAPRPTPGFPQPNQSYGSSSQGFGSQPPQTPHQHQHPAQHQSGGQQNRPSSGNLRPGQQPHPAQPHQQPVRPGFVYQGGPDPMGPGIPSSQGASYDQHSRTGYESGPTRPMAEEYASELETTQILSPEIIKIAHQYEEESNAQEPRRMERMLSYNELVPERYKEVSLASGGIDNSRVRGLSTKLVDKAVTRSIWFDVITLLVAVLIGVGCGFFLLKAFFPKLGMFG
jgi:serine/threonine protein kinase